MARTTEHKEGSATVRVIYRTSKTLKDGTHPFWVRITKDRKTKFIATGLSLHPKHWNDKHTGFKEAIRKSYPEPLREDLINRLTAKEAQYAQAAKSLTLADEVHDAGAVAAKAIENRSRARSYSVLEYLLEQIDTMSKTGKVGNGLIYKDLKNQLSEFIPLQYPGKTDVRFEAITVKFCNAFESFFRERGNMDTSLSVRFRTLRTLYNRAISEGVAKLENYPFARNTTEKHKFSVGKFNTSTRKRAITRADIRKIEAYQPTYIYTGKYAEQKNRIETERMQRAKDVFLFSFFAAGINFVDLCQIRWKNITTDEKGIARLQYVRQKTGGKFNIKLAEGALAIIEQYRPITFIKPTDYVFPILDANIHKTATQIDNRLNKILGQVNADLKTLGERVGIDTPLTTYVARHSFATSLRRAGVADAITGQMLGHKSEKMTTVYLDEFTSDTLDAAFDALL
ncbi:site-specific integrase [Spirosoma validum]|uniref:Site-specific integrase n=1 Tax=Spirosoma validum TaxID=2771355 RepID=A0A927AY72_9BACT|nr:site-specific integrase [Spirosoma validum]MBD2752029.1 site-specific integrase [Spirosoma validum]